MGGFFSFGVRSCFPSTAQVQLANGSKKDMSQLQVGEFVLCKKHGQFMYSPVVTFLHRETKAMNEYMLLQLANGQVLAISKEHMLWCNDQWIPARLAKLDDTLQTSSGMPVRIIKISTIQQQGMYAPLTKAGTIVVNDMVASCYVEHGKFANHKLMHQLTHPLRHGKPKQISEGLHPYCKFLQHTMYPMYHMIK